MVKMYDENQREAYFGRIVENIKSVSLQIKEDTGMKVGDKVQMMLAMRTVLGNSGEWGKRLDEQYYSLNDTDTAALSELMLRIHRENIQKIEHKL